MKYCLTFLFLLVIFTGCTSDLPKDRMLYASFPKEETLHSKVIQLDSVYMRYPFRVHVSGDQAVVLDLHGTDVYCHLFIILISIICLRLAGEEIHRKRCFQ